jgi:hypothetical protein
MTTDTISAHSCASGNPGDSLAPRYAAPYSVGMEPRGLYREQNGWAENEHSARVKYEEHQELDVSERHYRARGYQPPFDELPWLDEIATT